MVNRPEVATSKTSESSPSASIFAVRSKRIGEPLIHCARSPGQVSSVASAWNGRSELGWISTWAIWWAKKSRQNGNRSRSGRSSVENLSSAPSALSETMAQPAAQALPHSTEFYRFKGKKKSIQRSQFKGKREVKLFTVGQP